MRISSNNGFQPLAGKKICLDAGHGGKFPGAVGQNGTQEKDVTLAVCLEMQKQLQEMGAEIRMTRTTDATVAPPEASLSEDLKARVEIANSWPAELFISVHCNANEKKFVRGTETYHSRQASEASKRLASVLHNHMVEDLGLRDRKVKASDFYVIKNTNMPGVLVETAFISNAEEEALLADPVFQKRIATSLTNGVKDYFAPADVPPQTESESRQGCFSFF